MHCNTLQHTATHCNTLQHTATHCNTLQHTATRSLYVIPLCIYIHAYICAYILTCIHTHIHTYIHVYIHTFIHIYIHTRGSPPFRFTNMTNHMLKHWLSIICSSRCSIVFLGSPPFSIHKYERAHAPASMNGHILDRLLRAPLLVDLQIWSSNCLSIDDRSCARSSF